MDAELLSDIIIKGAGASNIFEAAVKEMLKAGELSLKVVADAEDIRAKLELGLQKAGKIGQPLPMAAAAVQQFYFGL